MPIANVIAHSDTLLDLAVWGVIAGLVQLAGLGRGARGAADAEGGHRRQPRRAGGVRRRAVAHRRPAQRRLHDVLKNHKETHMALMDFIKKQFIDIIQWTEDDGDTMAWRFPMAEMEIQNGASLTVRESQMAVFVNEGTGGRRLRPRHVQADHADAAGADLPEELGQAVRVALQVRRLFLQHAAEDRPQVGHAESGHHPRQGFRHGAPARLRHLRLPPDRPQGLPHHALRHLERFTSEQLEGQLRNTIVGHISDIFGESGVPFIDMASNQVEFGNALKAKMEPMFASYGLALDSLNVQNISLPEELQAMLDKRIGVNMMGGMQAYTQFQTAEAIPLAAQNEGGLAGIGAGLGVGLGLGQQVAGAMAGSLEPGDGGAPAAVSPAPTSAPVSADDVVATMEKLHGLVARACCRKPSSTRKRQSC
jgi:membrane protease subunit (stomatin/prohibitin family)